MMITSIKSYHNTLAPITVYDGKNPDKILSQYNPSSDKVFHDIAMLNMIAGRDLPDEATHLDVEEAVMHYKIISEELLEFLEALWLYILKLDPEVAAEHASEFERRVYSYASRLRIEGLALSNDNIDAASLETSFKDTLLEAADIIVTLQGYASNLGVDLLEVLALKNKSNYTKIEYVEDDEAAAYAEEKGYTYKQLTDKAGNKKTVFFKDGKWKKGPHFEKVSHDDIPDPDFKQ